MSALDSYRDPAWWKAYVIYLVIVTPLLILDFQFLHGWRVAGASAVTIFLGLSVKDRIQRKVWK